MHGLPALAEGEKPPPDSSDPDEVRKQQRAARLQARKMAATIAGMMENEQVRAWMYRLLSTCRAFERCDFPPTTYQIDALGLARFAAHREIAQFLTAEIMAACPELYLTMLRECAGAQGQA